MFLFAFLAQTSICLAQKSDSDLFSISYDEDTDKTTVMLKSMELLDGKESFGIGALFEYKSEKMNKEPCCITLFMTSFSKENFRFKKNHNLIVWADKEKINFGKINWQESAGGTAFILSGIAYPEEMFVGMKKEKFVKIANSKKVEMQIGSFKFSLSKYQLMGFQKLVEKGKL